MNREEDGSMGRGAYRGGYSVLFHIYLLAGSGLHFTFGIPPSFGSVERKREQDRIVVVIGEVGLVLAAMVILSFVLCIPLKIGRLTILSFNRVCGEDGGDGVEENTST